MPAVNFLCVHKKLRAKRLAPILIGEITRRLFVIGQFQAIYESDNYYPTPINEVEYFHRPLNLRKLIDVKLFSNISRLIL
jgi:glycylpeptide N-tetradecanoyltransferase